MTKDTLDKLLKLANKAQLKNKIEEMFNGAHINRTEDRAVLHVAVAGAQGTRCRNTTFLTLLAGC